MCQHVCLEVTSCCAFVFAMIAAEGLLSTMLQHVLFEITSLCAGELTLHALNMLACVY